MKGCFQYLVTQSQKHDDDPPFDSSEFRYYLKSINIRDAPIIPEHPESNAAAESFNGLLKKLVRTAKFNQKHWQNELCIFYIAIETFHTS